MIVRRFLCPDPACPRRIFVEPLGDFAARHARTTTRLACTHLAIGSALGGEAGARLADQTAMPTSPDTLLRRVRQAAARSAPSPRLIGIDDWAWCKRRRYGTIVVDLQTSEVIDLLPDRDAASVRAWLDAHPGIELVSRDRSSAYAQAVTEAAPEAQQVTDRWHLLKNVREAVERLFERELPVLTNALKPTDPDPTSRADASPGGTPDAATTGEPTLRESPASPSPTSPRHEAALARRRRRVERFERVLKLHRQGTPIRQIARDLAMSRWAVRSYLRGERCPDWRPGRATRSRMDEHREWIDAATPEDCERFQHEALKRPKNWRSQYPNSKKEVEPLSANTVIKWSVALQAAFERANRNAGKKCVRGVVPEDRLLAENPWRQFTWIRGFDRKIRQFSGEELVSLLDHLERKWPGVTVAPAIARVCLWSWGRKSEVMGLRWDQLRSVGGEHHFEIVGKWGIDKWFRIPEALYRELLALKTNSPFVFGIYKEQLRRFHERGPRPWLATKVSAEFDPHQLGDWFYERVQDWSRDAPGGRAYLHVFRKTSLQYARSGEDLNRQVASDARLGVSVMLTSYVKETDEEMRAKSNRTYRRIAASLPPEVVERYGHVEAGIDPLVERLNAAVARQEWGLVSQLTAELQRREGAKPAL